MKPIRYGTNPGTGLANYRPTFAPWENFAIEVSKYQNTAVIHAGIQQIITIKMLPNN
jgi:hypothetical protein